MKVFIFSVKKSPQIAAWIEDSDRNYISTIAINEKNAKGNYVSARVIVNRRQPMKYSRIKSEFPL